MGIEVKTFIDSHCHMFTAADVPLYALIKRQVSHPLRLLVASFVASMAVKWFDKFIKYFDSESIQNVRLLTGELNKAIQGNSLGEFQVITQEKIMTPLVMDFDLNGEVQKLEGQFQRLEDAAKAYWDRKNVKAVKVLPFVGLDPRKLVYKNGKNGELLGPPQIRERVDSFLEKYHVKSAAVRRDREKLEGGDVIGIKIYPPLGFDVYPDKAPERNAYLVVYERLAELEIPITAHCQKASFDLTDGKLELFTQPKNWANVLSSSETMGRLRINLGHFGGEKGVKDAIYWADEEDGAQNISRVVRGPSKHGWTYEIIKILKRYKNAYSDISAFDFGDEQAVASLLWILAYDKLGKFNNPQSHNYALDKKLLWGSDYPMILDKDYKNYMSYFEDFINKVINRKEFRRKSEYPIPKETQLSSPAALLKRMVSTNPVEFLFG